MSLDDALTAAADLREKRLQETRKREIQLMDDLRLSRLVGVNWEQRYLTTVAELELVRAENDRLREQLTKQWEDEGLI